MLLRRICAMLLALMCLGGMALADGADVPVSDAAASEAVEEEAESELTAQTLAGKWQLIEYSVGDEYYTDADLAERGELIELNADGGATCTRYGESAQGEWAIEDDAVALSVDGDESRLEYDGMSLVLSDGSVNARYIRDTSALYALEYDGAQAQAMCNLLNGGLFVRDGETLYGLSWDESGAAMLAARTLTGDQSVVSEARALDEQCMAQYLNMDGSKLYYVRVGLDGRNGIYALELDGGEPEQLIEGEFGGLQLSNGRLYYLDAEHKLYSCALDGSDAREVMGFDAYYAYMLDDDWLLYQSDEDEETLHRVSIQRWLRPVVDRRAQLPAGAARWIYILLWQVAGSRRRGSGGYQAVPPGACNAGRGTHRGVLRRVSGGQLGHVLHGQRLQADRPGRVVDAAKR